VRAWKFFRSFAIIDRVDADPLTRFVISRIKLCRLGNQFYFHFRGPFSHCLSNGMIHEQPGQVIYLIDLVTILGTFKQ
jgi:hypothetical protein